MALTVGTNTYIDATGAAEYAVLAGLGELSDPETSLKRATMALDRLYGARFIGVKSMIQQPLLWPRLSTSEMIDASAGGVIVDSHGNLRDFNGIQPEIEQATVELAVMMEGGFDPYLQPEPMVTEASFSVGGGAVSESNKYQGAGYRTNPLHKLDVLLSPLLRPAGVIRLVR